MHTTALVLFSGGQDSTTCLAEALSKYQRVETLGFDYGQRHRIELDVRATVREVEPATGRGRSKRIAEQDAAETILLREGVWDGVPTG